MSLQRGIDGSEPVRPERVGRLSGVQEERRVVRSRRMTTGTLACPSCDAPVAVTAAAMSPVDALHCPFCSHAGVVRQFLSLGRPSRPARVQVRVLEPGHAGARR